MATPRNGAIAASWHRSELAGLDPTRVLEAVTPIDTKPQGPLLNAAEPVLHDLGSSLTDTPYATLLVDRECRVIHRWSGIRRVEAAFDRLSIDVGSSLLEEHIGTNAPGTAMETRQAIDVNGSEHYAEALRDFSCFAFPIRHPLTRRVEGVLDLSSLSHEANPLLRPIVERAVKDIEQRLHDSSRATDRRLVEAFQEASSRRGAALVAIGEDITVSNQLAQDHLTSADLALLRLVVADLSTSRASDVSLRLTSGRLVNVHAERVGGTRQSALLRIEAGDDSARATASTPPTRTSEGPILVSGPPGSGRTTLARELAAERPVTIFNSAAALLDGDAVWARQFHERMASTSGTVIIDGVELLSDALLDVITPALESTSSPRVILVSGPRDLLTGRPAAIAALVTRHEETLPLSARREEIPDIARRLLAELAPNAQLTPGVERVLTAQPWPGNLREIRSVLAFAARQRPRGAIVTSDLPSTVAPALVRPRPSRPLDQAERDVIVHTLRKHDGNKVRAAKELGISRTTLYTKMRTLRISEY